MIGEILQLLNLLQYTVETVRNFNIIPDEVAILILEIVEETRNKVESMI